MQNNPPAAARILVVDDNKSIAILVGKLLATAGHDVRSATSGADALACLDEFKPDLVMLDLAMPVMDGYELAGRIRQRAGFETVPIVAVTGYDRPEDIERTRQAGIDKRLIKPVGYDELTSTVTTLLVGARSPRVD
jgi:CheY-like chemotaxis protein